jgi:hypothetical protein
MAKEEIPVFREARPGRVTRSADWNEMQQELRHSIRVHQHTRIADDAVDDTIDEDHALQITTAELQNGVITGPKLADGAVSLSKLSDSVRSRLNGNTQLNTDTITLSAGAIERIDHGLGSVPIAVMLGVIQELNEPPGKFEIYGSDPNARQDTVLAAVPSDPDGTFFLISRSDREVNVRWWAMADTVDS